MTLRAAGAPEPELALAPDDEEAGRDDSSAAPSSIGARRHLAEDEVAEDERQEHRDILERRDHPGLGVAVALGQQDLPDAAEEARRRRAAPPRAAVGTTQPKGRVTSASTEAVTEK